MIVSDHGGRGFDHAPSTIRALTPIVDAIGCGCRGGVRGVIRRGSDVLKAVALGARACMIGRPLVYGLGAGGEAGARRAVTILEQELCTAMALAGCPSLAAADQSWAAARGSTAPVPRAGCLKQECAAADSDSASTNSSLYRTTLE